MDLQLSGKKALVTGASQGLGRAIVKTLAAGGRYRVRDGTQSRAPRQLVAEIEADGGVTPIVFEQDFVAVDGRRRSQTPPSRPSITSTSWSTMPEGADPWISMPPKRTGVEGMT